MYEPHLHVKSQSRDQAADHHILSRPGGLRLGGLGPCGFRLDYVSFVHPPLEGPTQVRIYVASESSEPKVLWSLLPIAKTLELHKEAT